MGARISCRLVMLGLLVFFGLDQVCLGLAFSGGDGTGLSCPWVGRGGSQAAGLPYDNDGSILFCYAAGPVQADRTAGLVYSGDGAFLSHWDTWATGVKTSAAGVGLSTDQLRDRRTFRGWGYDGVWVMPEGSSPRLWWEPCIGPALVDRPVEFSGGSGTQEDPYLVTRADPLVSIGYDLDLLGRHFALANDVDLQAPTDTIPIGVKGVPFSGTFDGRGHAISGLKCTWQASYLGLFGAVGRSLDDPNITGCVRDLRLVGCQVQGGDYTGAIAGCLDGESIEGCIVQGTVDGGQYVGGLADQVIKGRIEQCGFEGKVNGQGFVGRIAGLFHGQMRSCYSTGQVAASGSLVAGLVGDVEAVEVLACYTAGPIQGQTKGGTCLSARGVIDWGNLWDYHSTGLETSVMGRPVSSAQMNVASTFAGWAHFGQWTIRDGVDRPPLVWEQRAGDLLSDQARMYARGTLHEPYLIRDAQDLVTMGMYPQDWSAHFRLVADIDLKPVLGAIQPIGTRTFPFTGSFDGNCHKIKNLWLNLLGQVYVGLFRSVTRPGGSFDSGGGLVVVNQGQIIGCLAKGKVSGSLLGGLVGGSNSDVIEDCYFQGTVDGSYVEGLITEAYEPSSIRHCYCAARVQRAPRAGAFARRLSSNVQVEGCFWDKSIFADDRNLQEIWAEQAAQIIGVNTEVLQASQVLKDAGWVFAGTWIHKEGDYPRL